MCLGFRVSGFEGFQGFRIFFFFKFLGFLGFFLGGGLFGFSFVFFCFFGGLHLSVCSGFFCFFLSFFCFLWVFFCLFFFFSDFFVVFVFWEGGGGRERGERGVRFFLWVFGVWEVLGFFKLFFFFVFFGLFWEKIRRGRRGGLGGGGVGGWGLGFRGQVFGTKTEKGRQKRKKKKKRKKWAKVGLSKVRLTWPKWVTADRKRSAFLKHKRPTQMEDFPFQHVLCDWMRKRLEARHVCANRKDNAGLTTRSTQFAREAAHNKSKSQTHWRSGTLAILSNRTLRQFFIKLALHELFVPQWSAKNGDALLVNGKIVVSAPNTTWLTICIKKRLSQSGAVSLGLFHT